jgi:hypothetical protein
LRLKKGVTLEYSGLEYRDYYSYKKNCI